MIRFNYSFLYGLVIAARFFSRRLLHPIVRLLRQLKITSYSSHLIRTKEKLLPSPFRTPRRNLRSFRLSQLQLLSHHVFANHVKKTSLFYIGAKLLAGLFFQAFIGTPYGVVHAVDPRLHHCVNSRNPSPVKHHQLHPFLLNASKKSPKLTCKHLPERHRLTSSCPCNPCNPFTHV